jgi:hypothetical protein
MQSRRQSLRQPVCGYIVGRERQVGTVLLGGADGDKGQLDILQRRLELRRGHL